MSSKPTYFLVIPTLLKSFLQTYSRFSFFITNFAPQMSKAPLESEEWRTKSEEFKFVLQFKGCSLVFTL